MGKMQMKRLTIATSYGSLSPGSCHTEISVESECIIAHSLVPLRLFHSKSKCVTILMKMTDLHENETACRICFHVRGFALRLVLKQRLKRTRKWPIKISLTKQIEEMTSALDPI